MAEHTQIDIRKGNKVSAFIQGGSTVTADGTWFYWIDSILDNENSISLDRFRPAQA